MAAEGTTLWADEMLLTTDCRLTWAIPSPLRLLLPSDPRDRQVVFQGKRGQLLEDRPRNRPQVCNQRPHQALRLQWGRHLENGVL